MKRIRDYLRSTFYFTTTETTILIWCSALMVVGAFGARLFPETTVHEHIDAPTLLAYLDSTSAITAAPIISDRDSGTAVPNVSKSSVDKKVPHQSIHVNTATLTQLQQLPGIGPAMAQRIVEARNKRRFASIEDLLDVKGIGVKKLEKMRPFLVVP